jgi:hypothetical protein
MIKICIEFNITNVVTKKIKEYYNKDLANEYSGALFKHFIKGNNLFKSKNFQFSMR